MNHLKKAYLDRIRSESAYPAFRGVVNIIALLLYVVGALFIIFGFVSGFSMGSAAILVVGAAFGLFYVIVGKLIKEISLMLADIADSVTDANSHDEFKPEQ